MAKTSGKAKSGELKESAVPKGEKLFDRVRATSADTPEREAAFAEVRAFVNDPNNFYK